MKRAAIEQQLAETEASIASAEIAAEESARVVVIPETGQEGASREPDMLVELLLARLLRVAHRDNLLRYRSLRFFRRIKQVKGTKKEVDGE